MSARVLLVDDSELVRAVLREVIAAAGDLEVVGEASDGLQALEAVRRLDPDVVTMDLLMPMLGGQETIRRIMRERPTPIVVLAKPSDAGDALFGECLRAGALEAFAKPAAGFDEAQAEALVTVLRRVAALKPRLALPTPAGGRARGVPRSSRIDAIGIVGSTGAPRAIHALLAKLPAQHACPIFVVQHTARGFAPSLVSWFASGTRLDVRLARDGERPGPGEVVVAPDDAHLVVTPGGRVALRRDPPVDGHRPAASLLLRSLAAVYGKGAAGVVLTGMGRDGADGLAAIDGAGGTAIVEDPRTAVVPGMPREALRLVPGALVETAESLPDLLLALTRPRAG